ncbi:cobalamin biosynthesis protein CbiX (plasmid) [Xenorhabdus stockiae]|uniref:cobalamin biosynthesis protein CbiX n=1 Tax=Xenorhabdus stockiae TaxID=351614 RepID=UPI003CF2C006
MYFLIIPIVLILSAAALALPWFMIRQGYRELVQVGVACTTVLGFAALTGIFNYADHTQMMIYFAALSSFMFLFAIDCALPLFLSSNYFLSKR